MSMTIEKEHFLAKAHAELSAVAAAIRNVPQWDHKITIDEAAGLSITIERIAGRIYAILDEGV